MLTTKEGWRSLRGEEMNDTMPASTPYTLWLPWLWAAVSTAAFIALWFWEVRRVLGDRRSTVDSAADLYNKALRTPWRFLPGIIMGFRFYQEE